MSACAAAAQASNAPVAILFTPVVPHMGGRLCGAATGVYLSAPPVPTNPHHRALILIHLCVVLWGFTAILGKVISLPALELVWWRMLLVTAALACVPRVWRGLASIQVRTRLVFAGI